MKMLRPLCALMSLSIMIGLCSCSLTKQNDNITDKLVANGTSDNNLESMEFEKFLENEKLEFWMNPNTTHWFVLNKDSNKKWYSYQPNSGQTAADQALFSLTYLDEQNLPKTMNTTENSVAAGQYTYEVEADKLIVTYGVGEYGIQSLVPLTLTEERYNGLLQTIEDEFAQGTFETAYNYVDITTITDATLKSNYLNDYPLLQNQPLYVINSLTISGNSMKRLESILQESGYTKEQYTEDSKYFATSDEAEDLAAFGLTVQYSLDGSDLKVSVPGEQIYMSSEYPLLSLKVFPYFAVSFSRRQRILFVTGWLRYLDGVL